MFYIKILILNYKTVYKFILILSPVIIRPRYKI